MKLGQDTDGDELEANLGGQGQRSRAQGQKTSFHVSFSVVKGTVIIYGRAMQTMYILSRKKQVGSRQRQVAFLKDVAAVAINNDRPLTLKW